MKHLFFKFSLAGVLFLVGCKAKEPDYGRPLAPGQLALRKITDPSKIPDFTAAAGSRAGLQEAIANSLRYLSKPSSRRYYPYSGISHERVVASLKALSHLLESGLSPTQLNEAIRTQFDVYESVGWDGSGTVLFTGYYTPIFDGSQQADGRYRYPLYGPPDGIVKDAEGNVLGRQLQDGRVVALPPRSGLENSTILAGKEILWLTDPFEAYVAAVQGSAKIRLPDGQLVTVGYAAHNGHPYHSVAEDLVAEGHIAKNKLSLQAMIDYFRQHPDQVRPYVNRNPRFVFFQIAEDQPRGSLNEPVIPQRTIATDKSVYPRAALAYLESNPVLSGKSLKGATGQFRRRQFVLDQDAGGAIRAPGRCDIYMGIGEHAGRLAGQTYHEGKLYYLFLREGLN